MIIVEKSGSPLLQSKQMLSLSEAAVFLGLSKSSLYKKTSKRTIPYYCPGGKLIFFRIEDLEAYMLQNRKDTTEEINAVAVDKFKSLKRERSGTNEK